MNLVRTCPINKPRSTPRHRAERVARRCAAPALAMRGGNTKHSRTCPLCVSAAHHERTAGRLRRPARCVDVGACAPDLS